MTAAAEPVQRRDPREVCLGCARPYADPGVTCRLLQAGPMPAWECNAALERQQAAEAAEQRHRTAQNLLLLEMLGNEVGKAAGGLRAELNRGAKVGEKWTEEVDDPDAPEPAEGEPEPMLTAGTVRFDRGKVTVRIVSEAEWLAWVAAHYKARLVRQPASDGRRAATDEELGALEDALCAADVRGVGGFGGVGSETVAAFWTQLQASGFELAKRVPTAERTVVDPDWQAGLFAELTRNAREAAETAEPSGQGELMPIDGNGVPVEGVQVTVGPPKLVVTPSHDKDIVDLYARQQLGRPLELLPAKPTEDED